MSIKKNTIGTWSQLFEFYFSNINRKIRGSAFETSDGDWKPLRNSDGLRLWGTDGNGGGGQCKKCRCNCSRCVGSAFHLCGAGGVQGWGRGGRSRNVFSGWDREREKVGGGGGRARAAPPTSAAAVRGQTPPAGAAPAPPRLDDDSAARTQPLQR